MKIHPRPLAGIDSRRAYCTSGFLVRVCSANAELAVASSPSHFLRQAQLLPYILSTSSSSFSKYGGQERVSQYTLSSYLPYPTYLPTYLGT